MSHTFLIFRLLLAWLTLYLVVSITLGETIFAYPGAGVGGYAAFGAMLLAGLVISIASSHAHRVRLVTGEVNGSTLSSRQRRQIEIAFEAGEAFDLVDAAIRELPGSVVIDSARDSLQVRAKVKRIDPYGSNPGRSREHLGARRNQILATVTPNGTMPAA